MGRAFLAALNLMPSIFGSVGGLTTPTAPTLPERVGGPAGSSPPVSSAPTTTIAPDGSVTVQHVPAGDINAPVASASPSGFAQSGLSEGRNVPLPINQPVATPPNSVPAPLSPDGTPLASVADVARAFGRAA